MQEEWGLQPAHGRIRVRHAAALVFGQPVMFREYINPNEVVARRRFSDFFIFLIEISILIIKDDGFICLKQCLQIFQLWHLLPYALYGSCSGDLD
ncbi:hypothetical protein D3W54_13480 [Komagataeibacter medellinensis]|uniref:Transposase n=1 Tax=Komagataeibacter medellinensis TaxID=1177712 RepID=A0ABQ6VXY4_9PROT|nr:hypothetical protein D3W54_13480 [Komagataeibacter medellinensis]